MTVPELKLWNVLRERPGGFRFRKQHPLGENLSLDFFCHAARLCVEVDGEAHNRGDRPQRDDRRDALLASFGIETLRLTAVDVLRNLEGVVQAVVHRAAERSTPPPPGSAGRSPSPGKPGED